MTFRWNVQIKTINYYTHIITLPTTLKQALLLLGPVSVYVYFLTENSELVSAVMPCLSGWVFLSTQSAEHDEKWEPIISHILVK